MILHTTEVTLLPEYRPILRFNNGDAGELDLFGQRMLGGHPQPPRCAEEGFAREFRTHEVGRQYPRHIEPVAGESLLEITNNAFLFVRFRF